MEFWLNEQQHIHPCHAGIGHANHVDDDGFLSGLCIAMVEIDAFSRLRPSGVK
jgi:hypothetical protein